MRHFIPAVMATLLKAAFQMFSILASYYSLENNTRGYEVLLLGTLKGAWCS